MQFDELAICSGFLPPIEEEIGWVPLFGRMSLGFQSLWTSKFDIEFVFFFKKIQIAKDTEWPLRWEAPKMQNGKGTHGCNADTTILGP